MRTKSRGDGGGGGGGGVASVAVVAGAIMGASDGQTVVGAQAHKGMFIIVKRRSHLKSGPEQRTPVCLT